MESLHLSICRLVDNGLFKGIQLPGSVNISHLFYADDAMLIGEWSDENLKVVQQVASSIGCSIMQKQFRYLGVGPIKADRNVQKQGMGKRQGETKFTWIAWNKVLASKERGGLGVSSFFALNRALLLKWVWRFVSQDGSLWRIIFIERYRVRLLEPLQKTNWQWHRHQLLVAVEDEFQGVTPIKVNIFAWRARRDCLPTRVNLMHRGVDLTTSNCPICHEFEEDINHILLSCDFAKSVMRRVCRWWDLDLQCWSSFQEWQTWFLSLRLASKNKNCLEGVFYVAWLSIWSFRNRCVFEDSPPRRSTIFDDIVLHPLIGVTIVVK
ncbi:RNA-directed DNA polymerase, eukaryota, partial [Tanacetum coccineum]